MSASISPLSSNQLSLIQLEQALTGQSSSNQTSPFPSVLPGLAANTGLNTSTSSPTDLASLLLGLNNGANLSSNTLSGLLTGLSGNSANTLQFNQAGSASSSFQVLMDNLFKSVAGGTGRINETQFAKIIQQMDPNGTSTIDAAKLFKQMDSAGTGYLTQAQFESALSGTSGNNVVTNAFKALSDNLFQQAVGAGSTMDIAQFSQVVHKLDPNNTSGVNAALLFSQFSTGNTGRITQAQFDAAIMPKNSAANAPQNAATGTAGQTSNSRSSYLVQKSIMNYEINSTLLSSATSGSSGTSLLNSLLSLKI
jgi:Ca2+-binding EF-hand superfamily protein